MHQERFKPRFKTQFNISNKKKTCPMKRVASSIRKCGVFAILLTTLQVLAKVKKTTDPQKWSR